MKYLNFGRQCYQDIFEREKCVHSFIQFYFYSSSMHPYVSPIHRLSTLVTTIQVFNKKNKKTTSIHSCINPKHGLSSTLVTVQFTSICQNTMLELPMPYITTPPYSEAQGQPIILPSWSSYICGAYIITGGIHFSSALRLCLLAFVDYNT